MSKHTPGPWEVEVGHHEIRIISRAISPAGTVIARPVTVYGDESEANARLIAAAPDLLEAASIVVFEIANFEDMTDEAAKAMLDLRKAVARATQEK